MFDMDEQKFIVEMHRGKVENINLDPGPLDAYDFALRASAATWREHERARAQADVPRHLGGQSSVRDLKLEGDLLVLMQNLRCFTRQFELLREIGVPV